AAARPRSGRRPRPAPCRSATSTAGRRPPRRAVGPANEHGCQRFPRTPPDTRGAYTRSTDGARAIGAIRLRPPTALGYTETDARPPPGRGAGRPAAPARPASAGDAPAPHRLPL